MKKNNINIAVVGLGYVGLPLAVEFGKKFPTYGFDLDSIRINELNLGYDNTGELSKRNIKSSIKLSLTSNLNEIKKCNVYIIAVPTPIDNKKNPNLNILLNATLKVAKILSKDDIVIYESTVYPGCTEEDCVPIIEKESNLKYNEDFFCGYSPERINPGDKSRTLTKIVKITSGSTKKTADFVDYLYSSIINAGTYRAESIKVAEAAKIIENCQRDINIAFINELSILFSKLDIDTEDVLNAAKTKWNFLPFEPGLVGGHCIGVDPYYLTYKANQVGYKSKIILSGRKLNDNYVNFVYNNIYNYFDKKIKNKKLNALIMGITFKENCPDIRNSKVFDLYKLMIQSFNVDVYDPYASKNTVKENFKIDLKDFNHLKFEKYNCIIICVAHSEFKNINIESIVDTNSVLIYDLKGIYKNKKYMRL
tara:strand:- start:3047 stop:4312 length:1266 start_codon:yes stop_codon:yes gene_type:complete